MNQPSPDLSQYSQHYRDQDEQQVARAMQSMQSRLEDFRLRLDLDHILPWIKGPDVLDFPIGTGRFYPNLVSRFNVSGYDIAPLHIERAKTLYPEIANNFRVCPIEAPDQSRKFDTVITLRTLYNIKHQGAAFHGVASILKPEGRWIFTYAPFSATYAELPSFLSGNRLRILYSTPYDMHAGYKTSRLANALHSRYRKLIEAGLVPYFAFKAIDTLLAKHGMELYVVEKSG